MEPRPKPDSNGASESGSIDPQVLERIRHSLSGLKFGTVTVVVHDGKVVQIERSEKVRL